MTHLAAAVGAAALRLLMVAASVAPESPSPSGAEAPAIEISVVGSDADLASVRALIRPKRSSGAVIRWRRLDAFNPLEVLRVAPDGGDPGVRATRCWIDLTDRRRAHLYFAGRSGARFLIRDVELSGSFDEVDLTSLAEVIDQSLAAVLENDRAGITRAEAERLLAPKQPEVPPSGAEHPAAALASPPVPVAPAAWGGGVGVGVFYAAQTLAREAPLVTGPGLVASLPVAVGAQARWQVGLWLSGQVQIPASASGDLASVRLTTVAARAGLMGLWRIGGQRPSRFAVDARLGAGADMIHLAPEPGTKDPSAALTPARWWSSAAFTGAAGLTAALGDTQRVRLGARVFADLAPSAAHYDVAVPGQLVTVVATNRVRPGLVVDSTVVLGRDGAR